ncbi:hypothetical protein [Streptomyces sp. JJ36]|uniref:hypothetical protein n=1 Tax=Streptomyces sp. JJ36 TaxID=2736645 RepID=UPI001F1BD99C|nr:hypothetical protein [Streptomyces sp. JJ36]MCF6524353.1 hypothetical protein [Streptomyces sp. JJ36]
MTSASPDLPLPDYDELSAGDLEHRIRSLSRGELTRLLEYEREHGARTPVVELLNARIAQLDAGSEPSPGGAAPETPGAGRHGSPVSPATEGQPVHPPPHGTPQTYARPKADKRH